MESLRRNGKEQHQRGQLIKRCLTFMLAVMVAFTSIPSSMAWADELPYSERPGSDEIILDDSVEEGDLSDIDLEISHTISKKGDKAVIIVSAVPSESGLENGVTKVTKVEINEGDRLKKGKRSDAQWEFTVKENGVYSFVIYYNSKDGEEITVASPSEIEKVEPTTGAEPQKPGGNAGGAGGISQPEENPDQEITTPGTGDEVTDDSTIDEDIEDDDKTNDGTVEGDSNQNTSNDSDQNQTGNTDSDEKDEDKGDTTENGEGSGSTGQTGSGDNLEDNNGDSNASTDNENGENSSSSDNKGDAGAEDHGNSDSSSNNNSDSSNNSDSDSSDSSGSGSSDSGSSGSSEDSGSGSSGSGSSDNSGSDEGSNSSDTSVALNVIDFFFPVIEAQASDFNVKKAVIVEYEVTNLFPEGDPEDVDVDIFDELTEEGAMITLLGEPSEIGLEKGVQEITDITLVDFEPEDDSEIIETEEVGVATDSETEKELFEEEESEEEEPVENASPSEVTYNTTKSSSAKQAEYQDSESEEGEYRFFVKENGTYTFAIRYGRLADVDFTDSTELVETQFTATYELDSIEHSVQFTGIDDITIQVGQELDLMSGVSAVTNDGMELPVMIQDNGGFDTTVPGTYKITYVVAARSILEGGNAERSVTVLPKSEQALQIESDVHGTEDGKTLEVSPAESEKGILSVSYKLPDGVKGRVLKFAWPEGTTATYPTQSIVDRHNETIDDIQYECLVINDGASGTLHFQIQYQIEYGKYAFDSYISSITSYEKAEEYLLANGKVNIGKIHVIADNDSEGEDTQSVEASIGDFTTTKMEEGPVPQFVYKRSYSYMGRTPCNVTVNTDLQASGMGTSYRVFSNPYDTSIYFNEDLFSTEYKPWCIKNVRVYAPELFDFKLLDSFVKQGVITGEDADGYSYMDIPLEFCATSRLNSLFLNTALVLQEGATVSRKTCTSKNTILTYVDYGGVEKKIETNPVVTVELYPCDIEEVNQLGIRMSCGKETVGGGSTIVNTYIENPVTVETSEEGVTHYKMPNRTKDIKVSIKYPDELWVRRWNFSKKTSSVSGHTEEKGSACFLEKLIIHLQDGKTVEYMVNEAAIKSGTYIEPGDVIPSDAHVDSVDFIFNDLYGVLTAISSYADTKEVNEKRKVESTGAINVDGTVITMGTCATTLIPKQMLKTTLEASSFIRFGGKENRYAEVSFYWDLGSNRKGTNCKIRVDDGTALQFFDGGVSVSSDFQGGKIRYETSFGRAGESDIPYGTSGWIQFTTLEPEEQLTMVEIYKDGTISGGRINYRSKVTYEELKGLAPDGEIAQLDISGSITMDEYPTLMKRSATTNVYIYHGVQLGDASVSLSNDLNVYQGEKMKVMGPINISYRADYHFPGLYEPPFTGALDYAIYYKLGNPDNFLFMGLESDEFEAVLVTEENEKYIKITPKETKEFSYKQGSGFREIRLDSSNLIFQAIPGAALGRQVVISDIYFTVDQAQQQFLNEQYRVKLGCDSAMASKDVPDWVNAQGLYMWDLNTKVETEILQQNLSAVNIIPGLGEIYEDSRVGFYPIERNNLNAMVSIGSDSDVLNRYNVRIPLPRNGKEITYSFNGEIRTAVSEYSLYLRDEIRCIDYGMNLQVRYKLTDNDMFIDSEAVQGRWEDVEEIEIFIEKMPAKSTVVCYMDLEAEEKEGAGEKSAYIAAQSASEGSEVKYGDKAEFLYKDFTISGKAWIDNNENGKYESGEPYANNLNITLLQDGMEVDESNYFISMDTSKGNYTLNTCLNENLSMRFDGLDGNTDGVKPTLTKANTNGSISVFAREGEWKVELPEAIKGEQSGYDLGIVKLPVLTANNTQVGYKSEVQADVSVQNQKNAPAVNNQIIYGASEDTSIATVSYTGLIKGLKENGLTTATASVINSLGDKVSATYQIAVSDNKEPILTVHPWVAIEGDSIPDLWYGVTVEEPEEEYPAWKTFLFGANKLSRSIPEDNKDVKIYTNGDYTGEISLEDALKAYGLYYMRYFVEDDKENVVAADTTLTVYGKMQGVDTTKHYFKTGETVSVPKADFYYLDVSGEQVPVTEGIDTVGTDNWILNEGPLETVAQTAVHPQAGLVSDGVIAGAGREATANVSALVDSKVHIRPMLPELIAIQDEFWGKEEMGWNRLDGIYQHGNGISNTTWETRRAERTAGVDGVVAPGGEITIDTSVPNVFEVFRSVTANEEYDNIDSNGQPLKNAILQTCKVYVVSKPVVEATDKICVTPDQALDESFIKGKITATATYHDGTNPTAAIPDNQIEYVYNKQPDGEITSVTITAWGGRVDNISSPAQVEVIIRKTPVLTLPDIHLRIGTEYGPENFVDRVLIPKDEHNEYSYIMNDLDTNTLGKYEAQYQVSDNLTGAGADQSQIIYVHGIPEITATDKSLYTHQSTSEQALIDIVKLSAKATVECTNADGRTEVKTIPSNELKYEVSNYVAGTAGRFKVTITADDTNYVPIGLEPMQVTKEVYVDVGDQLYDVTFTTNNGKRGTIDGGVDPVVKPTLYGHTAEVVSPVAKSGYHFDGFKTLSKMKATQELTLGDGTVIAAGSEIPVGTMLSIEQVQTIEVYADARFQAYFSVIHIITGKNLKLYVGEEYRPADFEVLVSGYDDNVDTIDVFDDNVDPDRPGTYQVKATFTDSDNHSGVTYLYVQVYGKTELEGDDSLHIREGWDLSEACRAGKIKASYAAPPAIPDSPWPEEENWKPAVRTEVPYDLVGTVDTQEIGLKKFTVKSDGQIQGREEDGKAEAEKKLFVHGHVILSADDVNLKLYESAQGYVGNFGAAAASIAYKSNPKLSVKYVEANGDIRTVEQTRDEMRLYSAMYADDSYRPFTAGTFNYSIYAEEKNAMPDGVNLEPERAETFIKLNVDSIHVKFSINNDEGYHKGDYEEGNYEVKINNLPLSISGFQIIHPPIGSVPTPVPAEGYHFKGFRTMTTIYAEQDIQLADGTIIQEGGHVPVGSFISADQIKQIKHLDDIEFQAYFSAIPIIKGDNIVLYENEEYDRDKLHIEVSDLDQDARSPVIDDSHVDTDVAGTYQVKITVDDADGNQAEKYLYVQVVGKTKFTNIPDLHIRKDSTITEEQLLANVKAVYDKPEEIPEEPWPEANKVNNGHAAIATAVEAHSFDVVNTDTVQKTKINLSAPGMLHGREMIGKADAERNIYIHGLPVIVAYDNGIHTHQSTSDTILEQIVQTGIGTLDRDAASAYVEYVQPDGNIKKVEIDPSKITYAVSQFVPLTEGDYSVSAKVDDFSVIAQAQAPDLTYATGEKIVKVVVADGMYSVEFEMGEHGGLVDPSESVTTVAHGKTVNSPILAPEEGYMLDYWVDEAGNKISDISTVVITENRKFTAEFKLKEFTVRFIGKNDRVIKTEIVKYGHDATPPMEDKDVKSNRFNGWSTSYTNITKDTDIYTTYWSKSGGGGPSGGGGFVSSGPSMTTTITDPSVPKTPFEDLVTIGTNPVPAGNMEIPAYTGLPKTGDVSVGIKTSVGYQATLIEGTRILSEDEPLVGQPSGSLLHVFEGPADWKKCILHIILLIISALEGIFYIFKRKKDKRVLDKLRKELGKEDK